MRARGQRQPVHQERPASISVTAWARLPDGTEHERTQHYTHARSAREWGDHWLQRASRAGAVASVEVWHR